MASKAAEEYIKLITGAPGVSVHHEDTPAGIRATGKTFRGLTWALANASAGMKVLYVTETAIAKRHAFETARSMVAHISGLRIRPCLIAFPGWEGYVEFRDTASLSPVMGIRYDGVALDY